MTNKGSNPFARVYENIKLIEHGRFFSDPQVIAFFRKVIELSKIGASVKEGAQKPRNRRHELGDLIERTYIALAVDGYEPTNKKVLSAIQTYDEEEIVQEITDETIDWIDWRGNEHKMKVGTFQNRLAKLRKSDRRPQ